MDKISADEIDLLLKYPLITRSVHKGRTKYTGNILCGTNDVYVEIRETKSGACELKRPIIAELKATNICELLHKIVELHTHTIPKSLVNQYRRILHDYSEFTRFHLSIKSSSIAPDLSEIIVTTIDDGGREHRLQVRVDLSETRDVFKPVPFSLPEQAFKDLVTKYSSLTEIYNKFVAAIDRLQGFFDVMDELDRSCSVIDPERPTRRDCHRRIWLGQNVSVLVLVNPMDVSTRPELKFLGPEHQIDEFICRYGESLEQWDEEGLIEGILSVLQLDSFPVRPQNVQDMLVNVGECSICFSLRFRNNLPDVMCPNKSCQLVYHAHCLYEWLSSVNSKRVFNQIHGQCPNCEKQVSCPLPREMTTT